jgi:hypothetical protein
MSDEIKDAEKRLREYESWRKLPENKGVLCMYEGCTKDSIVLADAYLILAPLVRSMRQAQKDYFLTRDREDLIRSKQLEKKVDEAMV